MPICPMAPRTIVFSAPDPVAGHYQSSPLPDTAGHSRQVWLCLLWHHCSFLLGPGTHKILFVPSKRLFPQSCGSSVIKFHWPSKSNSLRFSVPLPDPQIGKSVVGPRTFTIMWELLWYNCSPVCGSIVLMVNSSRRT